MARKNVKMNLLIWLVYSTLLTGIVSGLCGSPPYGNCLQGCFADCKKKIGTETDPFKRELAVMDKNICYLKCDGEIYAPQKSPDYDKDFKECTNPCEKPIPDHCLKGYLGIYLYCQCLDCCINHELYLTVKYDKHKCRDGCHEHSGKLGYPSEGLTGKKMCMYRPEYNETPTAWCHAWCTWQTWIDKTIGGIEANISFIQTTLAPPCVIRCKAFLANGIKMDFSSELDKSCGYIGVHWKCLSSVNVDRFIITTAITDEQIDKATKTTQKLSPEWNEIFAWNSNDEKNTIYEINIKGGSHKFSKHIVSFSFPDWFNEMIKDANATVTTRHAKIQFPPTKSSKIPWDWISTLLQNSAGKSFYKRSEPVSANFNRKYDVLTCTNIGLDIKVKMSDVKFQIEFYATVSDSKRVVPLTALELKNALKKKWEKAEYVRDLGAHMIEIKGTGTVRAEIAHSYHSELRCVQSCTNVKNWEVKTACNCISAKCDAEQPI